MANLSPSLIELKNSEALGSSIFAFGRKVKSGSYCMEVYQRVGVLIVTYLWTLLLMMNDILCFRITPTRVCKVLLVNLNRNKRWTNKPLYKTKCQPSTKYDRNDFIRQKLKIRILWKWTMIANPANCEISATKTLMVAEIHGNLWLMEQKLWVIIKLQTMVLFFQR